MSLWMGCKLFKTRSRLGECEYSLELVALKSRHGLFCCPTSNKPNLRLNLHVGQLVPAEFTGLCQYSYGPPTLSSVAVRKGLGGDGLTLISDETYLISSPASVPETSHQKMTRWNCWLLHQGRRTPGSKLCCSLPSNLVDSSCSRDRRLEVRIAWGGSRTSWTEARRTWRWS